MKRKVVIISVVFLILTFLTLYATGEDNIFKLDFISDKYETVRIHYKREDDA